MLIIKLLTNCYSSAKVKINSKQVVSRLSRCHAFLLGYMCVHFVCIAMVL